MRSRSIKCHVNERENACVLSGKTDNSNIGTAVQCPSLKQARHYWHGQKSPAATTSTKILQFSGHKKTRENVPQFLTQELQILTLEPWAIQIPFEAQKIGGGDRKRKRNSFFASSSPFFSSSPSSTTTTRTERGLGGRKVKFMVYGGAVAVKRNGRSIVGQRMESGFRVL